MTWARRITEAAEREAARAERFAQRCTPSRALTGGSYGGSYGGSRPKSEPYRDAALLEMARGRPCLLRIEAVCNRDPSTTAAAHANWSWAGKAGGRKADDHYSIWSCASCHIGWLDQGKAPKAHKEAAFVLAHAQQVLAWRLIALDNNEPERFRRAARRALERLNVTTGETA